LTNDEGKSFASISFAALLALPGCFFSAPECALCIDPKDDICIPAEAPGPPPDECGVFVSSSADAGGDGSKARPFVSLAEAFAAAEPGGNVYACGERFAEAVTMPAGLRLYGGLDCEGGFRYAPGAARTEIAPAAGIPLIVDRGGEETRIVDIHVLAPAARRPGGSSIAMIADGSDITLVRTTLTAGDAANGLDAPSLDGDAASPGQDGAPALDACTADVTPGGPPIALRCWTGTSTGGGGGWGTALSGEDGEDGLPPLSTNHGVGQPENDPFGVCTPGAPGVAGLDGAAGLGGGQGGKGWIGIFGYLGKNGESGAPGAVGQGGGGGGGARGGTGAWACGNLPPGGASGGGGGAGGCGGLGGRGGGAGGASIALVQLSPSRLLFENVSLKAGRGGDGGEGGLGQSGGEGGKGAPGGLAPSPLLPGCAGGAGGQGGSGGRGGGGAGGHSIGIAFTGPPSPVTGVELDPGDAGIGGVGSGETGRGAPGTSAGTLSMDP
jgi:hypothetical protein